MGAIAFCGVCVLNLQIGRSLEVSESAIDQVTEKQRQELRRRESLDRDRRPAPEVKFAISSHYLLLTSQC